MQYVNTLMLSIVTGMMIQIGREGTVKQPKKKDTKRIQTFVLSMYNLMPGVYPLLPFPMATLQILE